MAQKFLTDIEVTRGLVDSSGDLGLAGQVLSSTGTGTNWITNEANSTVVYQDGFTGDNSTVDFTLSVSVTDENVTQVYIDGVYQTKDTYSISNTTLTFSTAPPLGADIEVITFATVTTSDELQAGVMIIPVKNTHTASIAKGEPVYITGNVGSSARLQIAPADASNSAKMPAVGLLLQTLAVNAEGYVVTGGYLRNITTDTIDGTSTSSNQTVYVKSGGGLTMTKPTGTNLIQNIAKVARVASGSAGSLVVSSILRTNDIPNITNDYFWLGNSSGVATPTEFTSTGRGLLSVGAEGTASGDGNLAYNNSSGVFTYTPPVLGGLSGTTDDITEGSTNLYYTDARTRSAISVSGNALSYNSSTGVITSNFEESPTFTGNVVIDGTLDVNGSEILVGANNTRLAENNLRFKAASDAYIDQNTVSQAIRFRTSNASSLDTTPIIIAAGGVTTFSTDIHVGGASAARFKSDGTNTIIDAIPGSSSIIFRNSGAVEKMRLDTSGNLGIGTTNPQAQLHINEDTSNSYATLRLEGANRGGIIDMYNQTSYPVSRILTDQSGNIYISTSGAFASTSLSEKFTILTGGNVGIGTTSPSYKLEVNGGTALVGGGFYVSSDQNIQTNSVYTFRDGVYINNPNSSSATSTSNSVMSIGASTGNSVTTSLVTTGAIGIGQTSPTTSLHLKSGSPIITLEDTNITGNHGIDFIPSGYTSRGSIFLNYTNAELRFSAGVATNTYIQTFYTNGSERMRIDSNGYVTIGDVSSAPTGTVPLTIFKSGANANLAIQSGGGSGRKYELISNTAGDFIIYDVNGVTEKLNITAGGNVGIGATSPNLSSSGKALTVNSSSNANAAVEISDGGTLAGLLWGRSGTGVNVWSIPSIPLGFGAANKERMRLNPSNQTMTLTANTATGTNYIQFVNSAGTNQGYVGFGSSGNNNMYISQESSNVPIVFLNGGVERMKVDYNGWSYFSNNNTGGGIEINGTSGNYVDFYVNASNTGFSTNASNGFYFNTKVGIGTTSPNATLEIGSPSGVPGSAGSVNRLFIAPFSNTGGPYKFIARTVSGASDFLDMYYGSNHIISYGLNGYVGIGNTSPAQKLDVSGNIYASGRTQSANTLIGSQTISSTAFATLGSNSSGVGIAIARDHAPSSYPDIIINSSGNVGIGTASPDHKLHIFKSGQPQVSHSFYANMVIETDGNYYQRIRFDEGSQPYWGIGREGSTRDFFISGYIGGAWSDTAFKIKQTNGNVGINVSSPSQKLDVNGNAKIDYHLLGRGFRSTDRGELHLNSTGSNDVSEIFFGHGSGYTEGNIRWGISDRGYTTGKLHFYRGPALGGFNALLTLMGNNQVGINTENPSYTLDVNGDLAADSSYSSYTSDGLYSSSARPCIISTPAWNMQMRFGYSDNGTGGYAPRMGFQQTYHATNAPNTTTIKSSIGLEPNGNFTIRTGTSNGIEAIIMDSAGNFGINVNPTYRFHVKSSNNVSIFEDSSGSSGATFCLFNAPSVFAMGSITRNGTANSVLFNTGSDYRLKEDLQDFNALDLINNITAYDYKWKNTEQRDYGFVAHELQEVMPNIVTGEKDGERMQSIDYSKLTPVLLKAIQELKQEIETLKLQING